MAVGKVGSFATVQPAIVDFGGMAQGAFDKMRADEERKRREKEARDEKKRQEIERLGGLGFLKSTNIKGFNQGLEEAFKPMVQEYRLAKEAGDTTKMRELQENIFSMNDIVDKVVKQYDFYLKNKDDFDPDYFNRAKSVLDNIDIANMDVKRGEDGRVRFTVYGDPERKEVLFRDMTPNEIVDSLKIPYKFDPEVMVKGFVNNYGLNDIESLINSGGIIGTVKDISLEKTPRVMSAIDKKANEMVNDSNAMAWFGKSIGKYEADSMGYSTEEKKEAKEYFTERLKEAYKEKYDLAIQQKRTGSGRKSDDASFGNPQWLSNVGGKENVLFSPIIASGGKKTGIYYSASQDIVGVGMTKDGELYPFVSESIGTSSSVNSNLNRTKTSSGTSGKVGQYDVIEDSASREAVLQRVAELAGYKTIAEMKQKLFGVGNTPNTTQGTINTSSIKKNMDSYNQQ
jgi:hypothetical protein